jgi:hypothetical protein
MALRIGFGQYGVTPPLGVLMCGYDKRQGVANSLHDPLLARAMVFDDGVRAAALVVADVITVTAAQYQRVGALVELWTGIPRKHVIAAGTHTHSGPTPGDSSRRRPTPNAHVGALLPDLMASAVKLAWDDRRPATLAAATVAVGGLTVNRREPGGLTDPELTVVQIRRRHADSGLLLNFACHGVVMGPDSLALSADWIGLTRAALAQQAPRLFSLVAVAPSGDINPLPASIRKQLRSQGAAVFTNDPFSGIYDRTGGTFAEARAMGGALARAGLAALCRARPVPAGRGVDALSRRPDIGRRPTTMPALCRCIRVGDLVLVGMAGEQFVETGLRAKQAARARGLVPIVLSHAPHLAYVPTPAAFAQGRNRDYEVAQARKRGMAPDAADREVAAVERALGVLTR